MAILIPLVAHLGSSARPSRAPSGSASASLGFPECLDFSYRRDPDYIPYSLSIDKESMFVLPIANVMRIYQNEKIVTDETMQRQLLSSFFPDRHYLYVPPNLQITSTKMEAREEKRWVFPEGTTFIHEIYFKSNHAALPLEVRFEKMDNGNFRYGVYEAIKADSKSHCDTMQLRDGSATAYRDLSSRDNDLGEIRFHLQPRSPTECIGCHAMSEEVTTLAGANRPCAFEKYTTTRTIHANISEWVSKYRERFNHSPFDEDK